MNRCLVADCRADVDRLVTPRLGPVFQACTRGHRGEADPGTEGPQAVIL